MAAAFLPLVGVNRMLFCLTLPRTRFSGALVAYSDKLDDCHLGCIAATGLFPMLRIEKPFVLISFFVRRLADKSATADDDIGPRRIKKHRFSGALVA
ncbi:MAG: hypothetical protein KIG79_03665 [Bacilli bacterium]|nr:hypothetical protein [Bacilli bacterium]